MFTRGQIEWAIAQASGRTQGPSGEPRDDVQMKLKRLLDLDRKRGIDASKGEEFRRFAFLEGGLPGKGFAISYTSYDAFALFLALLVLEANVPQTAVIRLLRRVRPDLQAEHQRILRRLPNVLAGSKADQGRKIKAGQIVKEPAKMVFLVLPSGAGAVEPLYQLGQHDRVANIAHSPDDLVALVAHLTRVSPPVLVFELVNPAHQLGWWLERTPLIRRGRP